MSTAFKSPRDLGASKFALLDLPYVHVPILITNRESLPQMFRCFQFVD
jgi:hypothetical protein